MAKSIRVMVCAVISPICPGFELLGRSQRLSGRASRAMWFVRTLTPPLRATRRFLAAPRPWAERRAALSVLYRLWGVELAETARLVAGAAPERR